MQALANSVSTTPTPRALPNQQKLLANMYANTPTTLKCLKTGRVAKLVDFACLSFNQVGSYIGILWAPQAGQHITLSVWLKLGNTNTVSPVFASGRQPDSDQTGNTPGFTLCYNAEDKTLIWGSSQWEQHMDASLLNQGWHLITATTGGQVWVDDQLVMDISGKGYVFAPYANLTTVGSWSYKNNCCAGDYAGFGVWAGSWNTELQRQLMKGEIPTKDLLCYLPLNSKDTVLDVSGNSHHPDKVYGVTTERQSCLAYNNNYGFTQVNYNGSSKCIPYTIGGQPLYPSIAPAISTQETAYNYPVMPGRITPDDCWMEFDTNPLEPPPAALDLTNKDYWDTNNGGMLDDGYFVYGSPWRWHLSKLNYLPIVQNLNWVTPLLIERQYAADCLDTGLSRLAVWDGLLDKGEIDLSANCFNACAGQQIRNYMLGGV